MHQYQFCFWIVGNGWNTDARVIIHRELSAFDCANWFQCMTASQQKHALKWTLTSYPRPKKQGGGWDHAWFKKFPTRSPWPNERPSSVLVSFQPLMTANPIIQVPPFQASLQSLPVKDVGKEISTAGDSLFANSFSVNCSSSGVLWVTIQGQTSAWSKLHLKFVQMYLNLCLIF